MNAPLRLDAFACEKEFPNEPTKDLDTLAFAMGLTERICTTEDAIGATTNWLVILRVVVVDDARAPDDAATILVIHDCINEVILLLCMSCGSKKTEFKNGWRIERPVFE